MCLSGANAATGAVAALVTRSLFYVAVQETWLSKYRSHFHRILPSLTFPWLGSDINARVSKGQL